MSEQILIIDDEPAIAEILALRLRQAGYGVLLADSGPCGLETAAAQRHAAILLDIRMPIMDGFEVNRLLKMTPATSEIDVVFVAANVQDSAYDDAVAAGVRAFISKPYDHEKVIETLHELETERVSRPLAT